MGVVGTLQFDVLEYRLKNEYGVDLYMEGLPYEYLRWVEQRWRTSLSEADDLILPNDAKLVEDYKGNQLLPLRLPVGHQLDGGAQQAVDPAGVRRGKILKTARPGNLPGRAVFARGYAR